MSKLGNVTYKDLIKKLKIAGFVYDRQAKGSLKSGIILLKS